jgi:hypothetical protein
MLDTQALHLLSLYSAKIWRIRLVWRAAQSCVTKKVEIKDVLLIIVFVLILQSVVLLCWQVIDPLKWQREVIVKDVNGYALTSVGHCTSDNGLRFIIPLLLIDAVMLFYALYLCYVTRNVSSDYQEVRTEIC